MQLKIVNLGLTPDEMVTLYRLVVFGFADGPTPESLIEKLERGIVAVRGVPPTIEGKVVGGDVRHGEPVN